MSDPIVEKGPARGPNPVPGNPRSLPSDDSFNEKDSSGFGNEKTGKGGILDTEITPANGLCDTDSENVIIITGADAAAHLLPMRDDGEPALTFRSLFLASCLACFQAVMSQVSLTRRAPLVSGADHPFLPPISSSTATHTYHFFRYTR